MHHKPCYNDYDDVKTAPVNSSAGGPYGGSWSQNETVPHEMPEGGLGWGLRAPFRDPFTGEPNNPQRQRDLMMEDIFAAGHRRPLPHPHTLDFTLNNQLFQLNIKSICNVR